MPTIVKREEGKWYLDGMLWVPKSEVAENALKASLTLDLQKGKSIPLYEETVNHILIPRAFYGDEIPGEVIDCRPQSFPYVDIKSRITLDAIRPYEATQKVAVNSLKGKNGGILQLACGIGKTVIFLHYASVAKVPTIIMADTDELVRQWLDEINTWLEVPGGVGIVGRGLFDWEGRGLVVATYHTIAGRSDKLPEEFRRYFGLAAWDEGHHLGAPTFSKSASMFYGQRIALTATPNRRDGMSLVFTMHLGGVLYKNLRQDLTTRVIFWWSGIYVPEETPEVQQEITDKRGEIHYGLLSAYLGKSEARIQKILELIRAKLAEGRKVLVLSISIQTIANLLAAWIGESKRCQDIPYPSLKDIGEEGFKGVPAPMDGYKAKEMAERRKKLQWILQVGNASDKVNAEVGMRQVSEAYEADRVYKKLAREHEARRMAFISNLSDRSEDAGIMIRSVGSARRNNAIKNRMLTFSIAKYGKEGLNSRELDTVISCEPMTDPNGIQQFMGRPSRYLAGKKAPEAIFVEDDVLMIRKMAESMRRAMRDWPTSENGPIEYSFENNPNRTKPFKAPPNSRR